MTGRSAWLGRLIAALAVAAALGLTVWTLYVLDRRPRTHDAHLFAYSAGMAPEVSGRIVALHVTNNQRVKRGEPLVDIDPEPFELRVRQARAQVAALKAQINLTGRQVASQRSGADAAATQINHARAQLELAQDSLQRLEPLLGKGYVTKQQIDEARTNERNAAIALTTTTQQAHQARQAVGDAESLIAQLTGAQAAEALAERDLRLATLLARTMDRWSGCRSQRVHTPSPGIRCSRSSRPTIGTPSRISARRRCRASLSATTQRCG